MTEDETQGLPSNNTLSGIFSGLVIDRDFHITQTQSGRTTVIITKLHTSGTFPGDQQESGTHMETDVLSLPLV
ncbi:hypothetical protein BaRGS_00016720 [Batillaria attramentaria]|uniref:Uncharacterized protein n=1 Tax=Batillaria attramentaria TaxID=370345 RepID=A0ABD0KXQ3_9CAEN